jgi:hypothetical protein
VVKDDGKIKEGAFMGCGREGWGVKAGCRIRLRVLVKLAGGNTNIFGQMDFLLRESGAE